MLAEFRRVVTEAQPDWWLIENVPNVPDVHIPGWVTQRFNLFAWEFGSMQNRNRTFQFGSRDGKQLVIFRVSQSHRPGRPPRALTTKLDRRFVHMLELQGLPLWFDLPGLSRTAKARAIGNGVPVPMAAAVAQAIRDRAVTEGLRLCPCRCGRLLTGNQQSGATAACRKRIERSRRAQQQGRTVQTLGAESHQARSQEPAPAML
jgi:DNA (cytosine-5)-methyltransferase 1